jgi:hypothetical protein
MDLLCGQFTPLFSEFNMRRHYHGREELIGNSNTKIQHPSRLPLSESTGTRRILTKYEFQKVIGKKAIPEKPEASSKHNAIRDAIRSTSRSAFQALIKETETT